MVKRNSALARLHAPYLFPLMNQRKLKLLENQPHAKIISLGIGDTTEPLPPGNVAALQEAVKKMGTPEGYSGYGPEQGLPELRDAVAARLYHGLVDPEEVYISDGSKCDIGRLQVLFGPNAKIAVQDPAYPAYVFTSVLMGQSGEYNTDNERYTGIRYLRCCPENDFFPDLMDDDERVDVCYFCSPNNPTGTVPTHEQLENLVQWAKANRTILVFDSAYAMYVQDPKLPKSIYEIEGAREVAIETSSFSKMMGYTGVRLGWTIVPEELCWDDGHSVAEDWRRITSTFFNGASNIVQAGGLQALSDAGMEEMRELVAYYLENARILRAALEEQGIKPYGGEHAPFLWVPFQGRRSWEVFEELLEQAHLVVTPGSGFGASGEGFIRLSAFGHRTDIEEAAERLKHSPLLLSLR